jgi:hypothetical protein
MSQRRFASPIILSILSDDIARETAPKLRLPVSTSIMCFTAGIFTPLPAARDALNGPGFCQFGQRDHLRDVIDAERDDLPGGTLLSLGAYSRDLTIPLGAFLAGLGDHTIVTTLCPGGKERMRRLMEVIAARRLDRPLVTHRFKLDRIEGACQLFANQRDGVLKVAITP